ncbi:MAG: dehypoxanthine futalosine cyclase [Spirochaetota bacterium]|nr:dehypoxanthine futalosine cyclase [Spirochaetota bacterium]
MISDNKTEPILEKVLELKRISAVEAITLYENMDAMSLGQVAHKIRSVKCDPGVASYIIDRNINYTNVCVTQCSFCAFYRKTGDPEGYVLSDEVIREKISETKELNGSGALIQGGLNPRLRLDFYIHLLKVIKDCEDIHIHGFSPPEIVYISQLEKMSLRDVIRALMDAGLDSIPGGGAEILTESVRNEISPKKCGVDQWLSVMETAHELGLKTTATMMFGHVESLEDRLEHLCRIRELQDKTGGFTAFIPWTFQRGNTVLNSEPVGGYEYLKMLSLSRIFLDNIVNIQGSWVTQGEGIGQLSLHFGANDLGSIMIEENVVKSAGTVYKMSEERMRQLIEDAGYKPFQRNTVYSNMTDLRKNA